ncbi:TerD family protein [Pseudofrankia inefficax]|uniref:Stress protein n=1 Tax=Pseudofrankia inefficax (strain DSM 45817 / CECT 9037 / DDB 130130 / EuI1c) TaxID=298654 RepID=E3J5S2_PSEI1|nr:TerD family protein [Pseudofrankia inefficax]ADP83159.1 stress protein [Pseudofrankia inefficax]
MSVTLPKGGNLRLTDAAPGIEQVRVELGWRDLPGGAGALEVDGVVIVEHAGAASGSPEVLLAHQTPNPGEGAVTSAAPAAGRPGAETLVVTLAAIPPGIIRLRLGAAIFDAAARGQTFRLVGEPSIRVLNQADGAEIARYDVAPETGQETVMIFGELYRHAGSWKFRAVGQGYTNGLRGLVEHGHEVEPARPADVAAFLTRSSPTRSRRKVADHLHPPQPTAPAASPTPAASPASGRPAPSRPSAQRPPAAPARPGERGPAFSRPPVTPRPPAAPPRPGPPAPPRPEPPAPSRPATWSPLDLDDAAPAPPGASAPPAAPGGRSALDLGGPGHGPHPSAPPSAPGRSPLDLDRDAQPAPPSAGPPAAGHPGAAGGGSALDLGGGGYDTPAPADHGPGPSALDLGGRPGASGAGRSGASSGDGPRPVTFGERSARYRQRLEHVTALDEGHPVTAWTAEKRGSGSLTVTLRWTALTTRTGLPRPSDLQLGCLWQALDGASGVLQTLGGATSAPGAGASGRQVLALTSRDEHEGQTMFVDLRALATFKRFFVFAYGLHGAPEWDLLRPVLTVGARTGESLEIRLGDAPAGSRTCVVASFHVAQDDLVIRREDVFLTGPQAEAALRYGWSLEWTPDGMSLRDR